MFKSDLSAGDWLHRRLGGSCCPCQCGRAGGDDSYEHFHETISGHSVPARHYALSVGHPQACRRAGSLGTAARQAAGELGFTPSARASLGMIDESQRGGPRLIDEVNPFDEFRD